MKFVGGSRCLSGSETLLIKIRNKPNTIDQVFGSVDF